MALRLARPGAPVGDGVHVALVNNMPDSALVETERQMTQILRGASGERAVELRRHCLPGIPRGARARQHLEAEYEPADQLWGDDPDCVIVTGSEPLGARLVDEPSWGPLVALLDEAMARSVPVLLSCLAAHGALLALDGIDRTRLLEKCSGVWDHAVGASPLTARMGTSVRIPHSRHNDVPTAVVRDAGWEVLLSSKVGWAAVSARRGDAELLLVQGHPEYGQTTLLREWRRDLQRHVAGGGSVPPPPHSAVATEDRDAVAALHRRVCAGDTSALADFPFDAVGARAPAPWQPAGEQLYANWLQRVADLSTQRRRETVAVAAAERQVG